MYQNLLTDWHLDILEARPVEKVECPQKRRYRIIILSQVPKPDDEVERAEWPYQRLP